MASRPHSKEYIGSNSPLGIYTETWGLEPIVMTTSNISRELPTTSQPNLVKDDVESSLGDWVCLLGSCLFLLPTFGFMNSLGTVQSYLVNNQLRSYSEGQVGWISGVYLFLSLIFNIQVGPLVDVHGPSILGPIGAVLHVTMFLLMAECYNYWQFMLCLGVFGSVGSAMAMVVAVTVVAKLFSRNRGLAMGIALAGSSVGSIIIPIVLRSTYPILGWRWSMRTMALISAISLLPGIFCYIPFAKLHKRTSRSLDKPGSSAVNLSALRSPSFCLVTAGIFIFEFVISSVSGLLPAISTRAGFTTEDSYILLAVIGATSACGRIIPGFVGDKFGPFNTLLVSAILTTTLTGVMLVPFGTTSASVLYAWSAVWGFGSGSFISITPVCIGKTCENKDYGRYYGTMNFLTAFALLIAIPASGAMLERMGAQILVGLFTIMLFVGGACYFAARALLIGQWLAPRSLV